METSYTTLIACRGWHVYGKSVWQNPRRDEILRVKKEENRTALLIDPHSVAFTRKSKQRLVPDIVGNFPLEISRYVWFFMDRGGRIGAKVHSPRYRRSPIPKGGLEIIVKMTFTIEEDKKMYLERLRELIVGNYDTPEEDPGDESQKPVDEEGEVVFVEDESDEEDTLDVQFMRDEDEAAS